MTCSFLKLYTMNDRIILDERLSAAAELVPAGTVLLDVGTDHGYLPAKLILDGKISGAGASDVNEDPLSKARNTAEKYGIGDRISFYLSDGFAGVEDMERYTAVSICGMGGELIARIISEGDIIRQRRIPLILQPMSSVEELSVFLSESGFEIKDERVAFAADKVYRVIFAQYSGEISQLTPAEHILGKINIERGVSQRNFHILLKKNILKFKRIIEGKTRGGLDCTEESEILSELCLIANLENTDYENL